MAVALACSRPVADVLALCLFEFIGKHGIQLVLGERARLLSHLGHLKLLAGIENGIFFKTLEEHLLQFVETTGVGGTELAVGGVTAVGLRLDGVVVV